MKTAQIVVRYLSPSLPVCSVEMGHCDSEQVFKPFEDYESWCMENFGALRAFVKFDDSLGTKAWISASKFPLLHAIILQNFPEHSMSFYPGSVVYTLTFDEHEN